MTTSPKDLRIDVAQALRIWSHPRIPVEVLRVEVKALHVHVELALHYKRDGGRVCCGVPGCYVSFLGANRNQVPGLLETALGLPLPPHVSMTVHLRHEHGYEYVNLTNGASAGAGRDHTLEFDALHFDVHVSPPA